MADIRYTVPGLTEADAAKLCDSLQERLHALNDLHLTLKHVHWNVVGPNFIAVHEMLDPQVDQVRGFADEVAERMATLGGQPIGVPGRLTYERPWSDYTLDRATTQEHLAALDQVYTGLISSHRGAIGLAGDLDAMTEDMLIAQARELEQFQWFIRAHLERGDGTLVSADTTTEKGAADAAAKS